MGLLNKWGEFTQKFDKLTPRIKDQNCKNLWQMIDENTSEGKF